MIAIEESWVIRNVETTEVIGEITFNDQKQSYVFGGEYVANLSEMDCQRITEKIRELNEAYIPF